MNLQDIKDILTFASFRPEPDDSSFSWRKRFAHQNSLLLNIGKSSVSWMGLSKGCKFRDVGSADGELKEIITQNLADWKKLTDSGHVGISLHTRYVISLETNLTRRKGAEDILKSNPRAALGAKYERGKRYAVTHNPESNTSLLLTCDEEFIKRVETFLKEAGFTTARLCCGTYALLRQLLFEANRDKPKGQPTDPARTVLYVVLNSGSVCLMSQIGDQWLELRSRCEVWTDSLDPVVELIKPFKEHLEPPFEVCILAHDPMPQFLDAAKELFAGATIKDFTKPGQLWLTMKDF